MYQPLYSTALWRAARDRALKRDGNACTVARLIGGPCTGTLHVHHLTPVAEGGSRYDLENLATVCSRHHPVLEALRRRLLAGNGSSPRCPHAHRSADARRVCEARLARQRFLVA